MAVFKPSTAVAMPTYLSLATKAHEVNFNVPLPMPFTGWALLIGRLWAYDIRDNIVCVGILWPLTCDDIADVAHWSSTTVGSSVNSS